MADSQLFINGIKLLVSQKKRICCDALGAGRKVRLQLRKNYAGVADSFLVGRANFATRFYPSHHFPTAARIAA
jgi:hypothetical protein